MGGGGRVGYSQWRMREATDRRSNSTKGKASLCQYSYFENRLKTLLLTLGEASLVSRSQ